MLSSVKSLLTDLWNCFWMIVYIYLINCGSSLLSNIICSVLDVKSFYLSHQQHLNQLEAAVEDLTYRMYQHEISVMSSLVKSWLTDLWTWFGTFVYIYPLGCGNSLLSNIICRVGREVLLPFTPAASESIGGGGRGADA